MSCRGQRPRRTTQPLLRRPASHPGTPPRSASLTAPQQVMPCSPRYTGTSFCKYLYKPCRIASLIVMTAGWVRLVGYCAFYVVIYGMLPLTTKLFCGIIITQRGCKMQVTTSYKTKIVGYNHIFDDTLKIYRDALAYLIDVVDAQWDNIKGIDTPKYRQRFVELVVRAGISGLPS